MERQVKVAQDMKIWRKKARENLINQLGGICVDCGKTKDEVKLEFSHIMPLTEEQHDYRCKIGGNRRICLYRREAKEGLIVLRCHSCNTKMSNREPKQGFLTLLPNHVGINIPF